jgi:hypothetical protein
MQQGAVAPAQERLGVGGVTELAHLRRCDTHPRVRLQGPTLGKGDLSANYSHAEEKK